MLETIKMPMNLMNLTDNLPKPAYEIEDRPKTKQSLKNYRYQKKMNSIEKLAKTKYKGNFRRSLKKEKLLPLRLMKSKKKVRKYLNDRKIELKKREVNSKKSRTSSN